MTNIERLDEFLSTAEGQEKLLAWLQSDVTQLTLAAAKEMARPRPPMPGPIEASTALYEYGASIKAGEIIDFFQNPTTIRTGLRGKPQELIPDYGSKKLMEEQENG
jgi:hypothetical protein